jgi:acetamidase/formamidase
MRQETLHGRFGVGLQPVLSVKPGDGVVYRTPDPRYARTRTPQQEKYLASRVPRTPSKLLRDRSE